MNMGGCLFLRVGFFLLSDCLSFSFSSCYFPISFLGSLISLCYFAAFSNVSVSAFRENRSRQWRREGEWPGNKMTIENWEMEKERNFENENGKEYRERKLRKPKEAEKWYSIGKCRKKNEGKNDKMKKSYWNMMENDKKNIIQICRKLEKGK